MDHDTHGYELAQLNIGRILAPLDSPQLAGFTGGLEHINALAEAAPGFVWRLKDEATDDATSLRMYDDEHRSYLKRRREWFKKLGEAVTTLWWVPAGQPPTIPQAKERLEHLRKH